jgi:uncharacterized protein YqgC (DUF456 family)
VDLSDTHTLIIVICAIAMAVGVAGVVVPVLPGVVLCWGAVVVWALFGADGWGRWVVLAIATVLALTGVVVKYAWPGRNLKRGGVPSRTMLAGALLGVVGFFVVPVVGLFLGFVLGVWLAERIRLGDARQAWPSTKHALKAAGLSMLIELGTAIGIAITWLVGLVAT